MIIFYSIIIYGFSLIIVFLLRKRINNCIKSNIFRRNDYVYCRICILIGALFLSIHFFYFVSTAINIFSIILYQSGFFIIINIVEELLRIMRFNLNGSEHMQLKQKDER